MADRHQNIELTAEQRGAFIAAFKEVSDFIGETVDDMTLTLSSQVQRPSDDPNSREQVLYFVMPEPAFSALNNLLAMLHYPQCYAAEEIEAGLNSIGQTYQLVEGEQARNAYSKDIAALVAQIQLWERGLQQYTSFSDDSKLYNMPYATIEESINRMPRALSAPLRLIIDCCATPPKDEGVTNHSLTPEAKRLLVDVPCKIQTALLIGDEDLARATFEFMMLDIEERDVGRKLLPAPNIQQQELKDMHEAIEDLRRIAQSETLVLAREGQPVPDGELIHADTLKARRDHRENEKPPLPEGHEAEVLRPSAFAQSLTAQPGNVRPAPASTIAMALPPEYEMRAYHSFKAQYPRIPDALKDAAENVFLCGVQKVADPTDINLKVVGHQKFFGFFTQLELWLSEEPIALGPCVQALEDVDETYMTLFHYEHDDAAIKVAEMSGLKRKLSQAILAYYNTSMGVEVWAPDSAPGERAPHGDDEANRVTYTDNAWVEIMVAMPEELRPSLKTFMQQYARQTTQVYTSEIMFSSAAALVIERLQSFVVQPDDGTFKNLSDAVNALTFDEDVLYKSNKRDTPVTPQSSMRSREVLLRQCANYAGIETTVVSMVKDGDNGPRNPSDDGGRSA